MFFQHEKLIVFTKIVDFCGGVFIEKVVTTSNNNGKNLEEHGERQRETERGIQVQTVHFTSPQFRERIYRNLLHFIKDYRPYPNSGNAFYHKIVITHFFNNSLEDFLSR